MKKLLLLFTALACSVGLMAQGLRVSGTVSGPDGQPLPGVSVVEKGTTNGVSSDVNGHYTLELKGADPTLVFSFIGFATQEITVPKGGVARSSTSGSPKTPSSWTKWSSWDTAR